MAFSYAGKIIFLALLSASVLCDQAPSASGSKKIYKNYDTYSSDTRQEDTYYNNLSYEDSGAPQPKTVEVTRNIPVPYIKHVEVPVPQPYAIAIPQPVAVSVPQPYPVHIAIPQPIPVPILRTRTITIEKPVPYAVDRPYAVHIERRVPIAIYKPYPVEVPTVKHIHHYHGLHQDYS